MVTEAMHTWAARMKEQSIRIEINMEATSKESLNKAVNNDRNWYSREQSNTSLYTHKYRATRSTREN
jgi:hypothetical protein